MSRRRSTGYKIARLILGIFLGLLGLNRRRGGQ
jgi:hypothetical protein